MLAVHLVMGRYRAGMPRPEINNVDLLSNRVLFIDGEAVMIDKPSGLPVNRPRVRKPCVEDQLQFLRFGFQRSPNIVHRLDQDTSGCLILARNPKALKRFNAAFEAGQAEKTYLAVLDGVPTDAEGLIDMPLAKISSEESGWRMIVDDGGKNAVTHWRLLSEQDGKAFVEFRPATGRTHQLRVHAATGLGCPIVGDPLYGRGGQSMMLHASSLKLPREGKADIFGEAALPERFGAMGFVT